MENGDKACIESRIILNSVKYKYWSKQRGGIIYKQSIEQLYVAL